MIQGNMKWENNSEISAVNDLKLVDELKILRRIGRKPVSFADIMREVVKFRAGLNPGWELDEQHKLDTIGCDEGYLCDGIAYHPDGRFKILLDCSNMYLDYYTLFGYDHRWIAATPPYVHFCDSVYESLNCPEFKRAQLEHICNRPLSCYEAKAHSILQVLSCGDQKLLDDFVDSIQEIGSKTRDLEANGDICLPSENYVDKYSVHLFGFESTYGQFKLTGFSNPIQKRANLFVQPHLRLRDNITLHDEDVIEYDAGVYLRVLKR